MATTSLLGYQGKCRDPVYGGYPLGNGYRSYLPQLMIFAAPDSLSPFGRGGINPYRYCSNDPINRIDPSGHMDLAPEVRLFKDVVEDAAGPAEQDMGQGEPIAAAQAKTAASSAAHAKPPVFKPPKVARRFRFADRQWGPAVTRPHDIRLHSDPWSVAERQMNMVNQDVAKLELATRRFHTELINREFDLTEDGIVEKFGGLRSKVGRARRTLLNVRKNWINVARQHTHLDIPYFDQMDDLGKRLLDIDSGLDEIEGNFIEEDASDEEIFDSHEDYRPLEG